MKKLISISIACTSLFASLQGEYSQKTDVIVRRAAFDIGSGQIKVQVSDVDLSVNKIINVLFAESIRVPLREDLTKSLDGRLSLAVQNKTIQAITELMQKIAPFQPQAFHAIATEPLRLAKNGNELVQSICNATGVSVTILSQEEEGVLGFISAVSESNINPDQVVSWDLGGGSFQITIKCEKDYLVYPGKWGKVPMKNALFAIQEKDVKQVSTPNPISNSQAMEAIQLIKDNIIDVPDQIRKKLIHPETTVLGVGINPLWGMSQNTTFDQIRVLAEIESRLNLNDEAIRIKDAIPAHYKDSAAYVVSNLILAYAVMEALGIKQVHYVGTQGANATGTLLSSKYWERCLDCPHNGVHP